MREAFYPTAKMGRHVGILYERSRQYHLPRQIERYLVASCISVFFSYRTSFPHCRIGVSAQELASGKIDRDGRSSKFQEDRQIISLKNFSNDLYKYSKRALFPCVVPPSYVIMYMIQSGTSLHLYTFPITPLLCSGIRCLTRLHFHQQEDRVPGTANVMADPL